MTEIQVTSLLAEQKVDSRWLEDIAVKVLSSEKSRLAELSIVLVGTKKIKKINWDYREKNKETDVLSFFYDNFPSPSDQLFSGAGEIFICLPEVRKRARELGLDFQQELARVLIHGVLHVLGYDHEGTEEKEKVKMRKKENYYFQLIIGQLAEKKNG
jgi:probable rRNA maturation factor